MATMGDTLDSAAASVPLTTADMDTLTTTDILTTGTLVAFMEDIGIKFMENSPFSLSLAL